MFGSLLCCLEAIISVVFFQKIIWVVLFSNEFLIIFFEFGMNTMNKLMNMMNFVYVESMMIDYKRT